MRGPMEREMNDFILETTNLTKSFGGLTAINDVNFGLLKGNIHAIIGPNGAGKTTFFNLMSGYFKPTEGRIHYKGGDITGLQASEISGKGLLRSFQVASIYPMLTALENIKVVMFSRQARMYHFFKGAKGLCTEEACGILRKVGLLDQRDAVGGKLSHGDRKRLELGIVIANEPEVVLLDEPTAGMSPDETRQAMELIERIALEQGLTILFTEHDMSVVFGIARRITVFHQGQVLAEGKPEEVKRNEMVQNVYLGEESI